MSAKRQRLSDVRRKKAKIKSLNEEIETRRVLFKANKTEAKEVKRERGTLEREVEKLQKTSIILRLGHWRFQRNMNAQDAAKAFISFHMATIIAGSVLIFQSSPLKELGIALVVGGLFAFGTFLSSIWEKVYDEEKRLDEDESSRHHARTSVELEELVRLLEELREHRKNLIRQPSAISANLMEKDGNIRS